MAVTAERAPLDENSQFWMYPDRRACRRCRHPFGDLVINRLYCTYECAKKTPPSDDVRDWPRYCRTRAMTPKVRYFYPEAVDDDPQSHETFHVYHCNHCGMYHIGHKRKGVRSDNIPAQRSPSS